MPMSVLFAVGWSNSQPADETVGLFGVPKAIVSAVSVMLPPPVDCMMPWKLAVAGPTTVGVTALRLMAPVLVLMTLPVW